MRLIKGHRYRCTDSTILSVYILIPSRYNISDQQLLKKKSEAQSEISASFHSFS